MLQNLSMFFIQRKFRKGAQLGLSKTSIVHRVIAIKIQGCLAGILLTFGNLLLDGLGFLILWPPTISAFARHEGVLFKVSGPSSQVTARTRVVVLLNLRIIYMSCMNAAAEELDVLDNCSAKSVRIHRCKSSSIDTLILTLQPSMSFASMSFAQTA